MRRLTPKSRKLAKKFDEKVGVVGEASDDERESSEECSESTNKPLKVLAFDEGRFGLINWHRRR